jgi:CheY-like chemotaxis protein
MSTLRPSSNETTYIKKRIMIVEDEPGISMIFSTAIARAGYSVIGVASTGNQAVGMVKNGRIPDLVLMDQRMPNLTGVEASRQIKTIAPETKVVIVSAYDIPLAERGVADAILLKPVKLVDLLDCVKGTLEHR